MTFASRWPSLLLARPAASVDPRGVRGELQGRASRLVIEGARLRAALAARARPDLTPLPVVGTLATVRGKPGLMRAVTER